MQFLLLFALLVALVAVVFALQNIVPVTVAFLGWTFEGSLALVLFVALIAGAVITLAASTPSILRDRRTIRRLRRQVTDRDHQLTDARRRLAIHGDQLRDREPPISQPLSQEPEE